MTDIRCQIITRRASDLPRDYIVNTVHFTTDTLFNNPSWQTLANDVRNLWTSTRTNHPPGYGVEVKVYDLDDPIPRPIKATAVWTAHPTTSSTPGPREVAVCLSFRGDQNVPRKRGRIFIGPMRQDVMLERPSADLRTNVLALATGLANIGGFDINWCVRSRFPILPGDQGGTMWPVQASWVDDEFDTIRSRGLRGTTRAVGVHSE